MGVIDAGSSRFCSLKRMDPSYVASTAQRGAPGVRAVGRELGVVGMDLFNGGRRAGQVHRIGEGSEGRQDGQHLLGVRRLGHALHPQGHLNDHLGRFVGRLADGPAAVRGLAPGGPVH